MGRGRAKAKQTKVARELKYSSPSTDLTALQRELAGTSDSGADGLPSPPSEPVDPDPYALDEDDQDDDGGYATDRWASSR